MTSEDFHQEFNLSAGDLICIENHRPMDIMLLDDREYQRYKTIGGIYHYQNHNQTVSPIKIQIPTTGRWHIVIKNYEGGEPPRVTTKKH